MPLARSCSHLMNFRSILRALRFCSSFRSLRALTATGVRAANFRTGAVVALLILAASGYLHAQTCVSMSLGSGASLNGFVPFPSTNAWNTNIASAPLDPNSAAIVAAPGFTGLHTHVNFGSSVDDGGIPYVVVDSTQTPAVPINVIDYASESDVMVAPYPADAPIEGAPADCTGWPDTYQGDAHVLVLDRNKCFLYETFNTNRCNGLWNSSSETIWDMTNSESRPWGWTSADAAGLPIFPGLVRYDEVASGVIHHAIRFTMEHTKNDASDGYFVEPASHAAGTDWGVSNIMGMRIRLKASFDISGYSAANQVILTALKQYGMILADNGGSLFIQGATDPRWDDDDLSNLGGIDASNFEVVQMTPAFPGYDSATAPTGALPVINSFSPTASSVAAGSPVTFNYSATGDSYDYIDMIGPVTAGSGSVTISPTATQTYTMYSTNAYGQTASTPVTVAVPGSVVSAPAFTPSGGAYSTAQTVTLSTSTYPYATIYYTTDGSTPTYPITGTTREYPVTPTPPNSQGNVNSITVSASETVKAIALAPGYTAPSAVGSATYNIGESTAATPTFLPAGGTYTSVQMVAIGTTTATGSPAIYYTTDGSTPTFPITGTTKLYGGAITVSASETLNAITAATGFSNSAVGTASYIINLPQAATPTFTPQGGTYTTKQNVVIATTTTTGSPVVYYTTDGSNPATSSTAIKYSTAVPVSATETLHAVAEATGFANSAVATAVYTINSSSSPSPAVLTSPKPGSTLGVANVTFAWSAGTGVTAYELLLGTNGPGTSGLYNSGSITTTSATVASLPPYGVTVYARLLSLVSGAWQHADYTYFESGTSAILTSPTPGTTLAGAAVTFKWSVGFGVTGYQLLLGTNGPGTSGLYNSGVTTATSAALTNLPLYGVPVYARLFSEIGGVWQHADYTYTEAGTPAILTSPAPGTTLPNSSVTFKWNTGFGITHYQLLLGANGIGSSSLYNSGAVTTTSATVTTLPAYGATVYARLLSQTGGAWQYHDYTYTEAGTPAILLSPKAGTTLGTSNIIFTWSKGMGNTNYQLLLGANGIGSSSLYNSGSTTATSVTVPTLPAYGVTVYARILSESGGVWQYVDYTFTEK
jgi:hypothetical protein